MVRATSDHQDARRSSSFHIYRYSGGTNAYARIIRIRMMSGETGAADVSYFISKTRNFDARLMF